MPAEPLLNAADVAQLLTPPGAGKSPVSADRIRSLMKSGAIESTALTNGKGRAILYTTESRVRLWQETIFAFPSGTDNSRPADCSSMPAPRRKRKPATIQEALVRFTGGGRKPTERH